MSDRITAYQGPQRRKIVGHELPDAVHHEPNLASAISTCGGAGQPAVTMGSPLRSPISSASFMASSINVSTI